MIKIRYSNITGRDEIFRDSPVPSRFNITITGRDGIAIFKTYPVPSRPANFRDGTGTGSGFRY